MEGGERAGARLVRGRTLEVRGLWYWYVQRAVYCEDLTCGYARSFARSAVLVSTVCVSRTYLCALWSLWCVSVWPFVDRL